MAQFTVTYEDIIGKEAVDGMREAIAAFPKDQLKEALYHLTGTLSAMLIEPSGTIRMVYPSNGSKFTLEELQSFVDGSIELLINLGDCEVYVNDNGTPDPESGIEGLPINIKATALILQYAKPDYPMGLHGNVLFLRNTDVDE